MCCQSALTASTFHGSNSNFSGSRIKQRDDVAQRVAIFGKQRTKFILKYEFVLKILIVIKSFEARLPLGDSGLQKFLFSSDRHVQCYF